MSWSSSPSYGVWKFSKESFLFSLKCHAGLPAVKMGIKAGNEEYAVCYCSIWGPVFGGGHDLFIISNANTNTSYSNVGNTYHLPAGATDPHFLTGSEEFKVTDYEVFQV